MYIWREISVCARPGFIVAPTLSDSGSWFDFDDGTAMSSVSANDVNIRPIKAAPRRSSRTIIPFILSMTHLFHVTDDIVGETPVHLPSI
jgi:hypothetical protein